MSEETYHDIRQDHEGDFTYGPGESPDYKDSDSEIDNLWDLLFECPPGSQDALRLLKLIHEYNDRLCTKIRTMFVPPTQED